MLCQVQARLPRRLLEEVEPLAPHLELRSVAQATGLLVLVVSPELDVATMDTAPIEMITIKAEPAACATGSEAAPQPPLSIQGWRSPESGKQAMNV